MDADTVCPVCHQEVKPATDLCGICLASRRVREYIRGLKGEIDVLTRLCEEQREVILKCGRTEGHYE